MTTVELAHRRAAHGLRRTRPFCFAVVLVVAAMSYILTACGGNSNSTSTKSNAASSSAGSSVKSVGSLTVSLPYKLYPFHEIVLADELGYFKKYGLDLKIEVDGGNTPAVTTAGHVDLAAYGVTPPLSAAMEGRPATIIYNFLGNDQASIITPKDSPFKPLGSLQDTLMQLSGATVAAAPLGTSYGDALTVSNYIVQHGGKALTIHTPTQTSIQQAQIASGQIAAAFSGTDAYYPLIDQGKAKVLVPATDPGLQKLLGGNIASSTVWGLTSTLRSKPQAITAFVAGIRGVHQYLQSLTADQLVGVLTKSPSYKGQISATQIKIAESGSGPFYSPANGYISDATWSNTLKAMSKWGLKLDLGDPKFAYKNIVDMSFWNAAGSLR